MATVELLPPRTEADWRAYHDIRRRVLFELRGVGHKYDANHPDDTKAGNHPLILFEDGRAVGVIRVDIHGPVAMFRRVAIDDRLQRRGLGRRMLMLAESFAAQHGCRDIESHVDLDAVEFYARCGFLVVKPPGRRDKSVVMSKAVSSE